ncbi:hypothetical protein EU805_02780 [Salipiger sp. IMCC34102]|uniref:hypothetical protein n=1 Tax=Salipiger sp. IMCC34102 TaxID=2510647 RepID=UPI00101D91B5|nr:hypothetical protein [Salipiger sp. IMCC34102]RYH04310.1 hypothetical protein EU805_02780 [Salipiger sp. IMCC34102]
MILSRWSARRHIAAGSRPGWLMAWGPVAADAILLALVFALALPAIWPTLMGWPIWLRILALFAGVFLPIQAVLITASLWAARARGQIFSDSDF